MSSFISSLLNELGLRTRLTQNTQPQTQPQDEVESSRDDQPHITSTSDTDNPDILDPSKERGGSEQTSGDVGALPCPPFFATLPKDMNGRTPESESTRLVPRNGAFASQPLVVPGGRLSDTLDAAERRVDILDEQDEQSQHATSTRPPGDPPGPNTISRSEVGNESGHPPDNHLEVDGLGPVSLPEDDGMGWLRKKIHAIRDLDLSSNDKARMIHDLMTERYNFTQNLSASPFVALSPTLSPSRMNQSFSQPTSGIQQPSERSPRSPSLIPLGSTHENSFSLTPEDLMPTYVPGAEPESPVVEVGEAGEEDPDTEEQDEASLGCQHYVRNVKLQCFLCKKWYTCRFCHDEVEDHHLIRKDTENMLCMLCGHPQPAAQSCSQCNKQTARYYCDICKLWDNDSKKSIYHCSDCGICRIGQGLGKDFFHCKVSCIWGPRLLVCRVLTRSRPAVSACRFPLRIPIVASRDLHSVIVPYVGITCSLHQRPLLSCVVVIAFITSACLSTRRHHFAVLSVARPSPTWSRRSGIWTAQLKASLCLLILEIPRAWFTAMTAVQSRSSSTTGWG